MDRYVQFAVAAAIEAVADSGLDLDAEDRERIAVALGSAVGGTTRWRASTSPSATAVRDWLVDPDYVSPYVYQAFVPSALASEVSVRFGAQGPSVVVSTGCTSGIDAIGYGHQLIQDGEADVVISGASESGISPISMACFDPIRATSARNDEAATASRPFDRDRDGFVMGEGGRARARGARPRARPRRPRYCEISGYAGLATRSP